MNGTLIERIKKKKIIAIVRGISAADCIKTAQALYEGGIELMEVTFDHSDPAKYAETAEAIREICRLMGSRMCVGVGTVLSEQDLLSAKNAGAQFIISPNCNEELIRHTKEYGLLSIPGAVTPTEALKAYQAGADFVKIFPADVLGPSYFRALRGPLSQIPFLAVGGIQVENMRDFLSAGCCGVGCGGKLVNRTWIEQGAYDHIAQLARQLVEQAGR